MSLALVIARFKTGTYTISRPGTDTYTDGVRTAGSPSTFSADLSIQPTTGRDLKALPEGRRAEDAVTLWTITEVRVGDTFTDAGLVYEIYRVPKHRTLATFYRAFAAAQGTPNL